MSSYRCYLLDEKGHILSGTPLDCVTDDAAKIMAREHLKQNGHSAAEIWEGTRRVLVMKPND